MSDQIPVESFKAALRQLLDETFSHYHGLYLDKGTSLYETLEGVSAEEASRGASPKSATVAAQVEHVRYYFDVLDEIMRTQDAGKKYNWREIWDTVREMTPQEWDDAKRRLRESHERVMARINALDKWDGKFDIAGGLSLLAHTAYHLGGIRQALGAIRANSQTSATAR